MGWFWGSTPAEHDEEREDDLIVSVEYLKRKAESLLHWAAQINKEVFSEKKLRKYLSTLKMSQTDIDVLLAHLTHSKQMA